MKYHDFKKAIQKPYFSTRDLSLRTIPYYQYQLNLWKQKGRINHLKRGLYYFTSDKRLLSSEEISFLLYEPSYLSMEFAMSVYGFIPEMVLSYTALTTKTTRRFQNDFGSFFYHHISSNLFFGYTVKEMQFGKYCIAEPEKALLDFFYFHLGQLDGQDAIDELRLNYDEIRDTVDREKLITYCKEFQVKKLETLIQLVLQQC